MQFNISLDQLSLLGFLFIISLIIWGFITSGRQPKTNKRPKDLNRYFFRKKLRSEQNKEAASRWKAKTKRDPNMISNEPLDFEKAGDLKHQAYVQAQWDEIKKEFYGWKD